MCLYLLFSELASYNVPKYQTEVPKKDKMVKETGAEINVAKLEAMVGWSLNSMLPSWKQW